MRSTTRQALALTCAVGAAMISMSLAPAASATTTEPSTGAPAASASPTVDDWLRQRLELICARVPNAITRTERLTERLAGDATTPGSLLWLEEKAAEARETGRDDLATGLENRLEVRTQLADLLPERLEFLQRAVVRCEETGL